MFIAACVSVIAFRRTSNCSSIYKTKSLPTWLGLRYSQYHEYSLGMLVSLRVPHVGYFRNTLFGAACFRFISILLQ